MDFINNTQKNFIISHPDFVDELVIKQIENNNGVEIYRLFFKLNDLPRSEMLFRWTEDSLNIQDVFKPWYNADKRYSPYYNKNSSEASIFLVPPMIAAVSADNKVVLNVSVSDCLHSVRLCLGSREEYAIPEIDIYYFNGFPQSVKECSFDIRIDKRVVDFSASLKSATEYLYREQKDTNYKGCFDNLYSTWYNFHRDVDQETLTKEVELASQFGMKTIIIDDGWQIEHEDNPIMVEAYQSAGDWKVAKTRFPDMVGFVNYCHSLDIKVMLWITVPFLGYKTEAYKRFNGKFLYDNKGSGAGVIDPRYKECRDYLINSCVQLVKNYNLDGLKLDFIDSFRNPNNIPFNDEMDIDNLPSAVERLLGDIYSELHKVLKEPLVEYRQNYTSPALLKNANMIRVMDCPIDYKTNYTEIANLRLITKAAVHSDMILFAEEEPAIQKARHLYASLFSVPQISLVLQKASEETKAILKTYLEFHDSLKEVIFANNFEAIRENGAIALATNYLANQRLTAIYSNRVVKCDKDVNVIVNMTGSKEVYLELEQGNYLVEVKSYKHELLNAFEISNQQLVKINQDCAFIVIVSRK